MKKRVTSALMAMFAVAVAGVLLTGADAFAKRPGGGGGIWGCPYWNIMCLDVWDPVICSNGQIYSNDCYALRACQFDCEEWGGYTQ